MNGNTLTPAELERLERLEDEQAKAPAVVWDEVKTVRGVVVRDVEVVSFTDSRTGEERSKRVVTLRTPGGWSPSGRVRRSSPTGCSTANDTSGTSSRSVRRNAATWSSSTTGAAHLAVRHRVQDLPGVPRQPRAGRGPRRG